LSKYKDLNMDWLAKEVTNSSGIICSILFIDGIPYNEFCKLFGQPHGVNEEESDWLFKMFNDIKIEVRYRKLDYVLYRMEKLDLKTHPPVDVEKIDYLSIMGDTRYTIIFYSYLKSIFSLPIKDNITKQSIKAIFGDV